jgi:hypothetical protein
MSLFVKRAVPRRDPRRYPIGSTLTLRDGRVFEVVQVERDVDVSDYTDPCQIRRAVVTEWAQQTPTPTIPRTRTFPWPST